METFESIPLETKGYGEGKRHKGANFRGASDEIEEMPFATVDLNNSVGVWDWLDAELGGHEKSEVVLSFFLCTRKLVSFVCALSSSVCIYPSFE
jgi:hypothetical protein